MRSLSRFFLLIMIAAVAVTALAPGRVEGQEGSARRPVIFIRSNRTEPAAVTPGQALELFIELHNVGAASAHNVLVSFSGEGFIPEGTSSIKNVPGMQPDEHAFLSQSLRAATTLAGGTHSFTVQLSYQDSAGANFSSSEVVGINVIAPTATPQPRAAGRPQLVIEQVRTEPALPLPGEPFTLTLTLHNVGTGAARNVLLTNGSPSNFAPVSTGNVAAVGNVGWQETAQVAVRLVAARSATPGLHVHPIKLDYDNVAGEHISSEQNVAVELTAPPAEQAPSAPLVVIETYQVEPSTLSPGQPFTLTLQVHNVGGAAARQITLEFGSSSTSQTSSIDIAPLGTGNVRFLPSLDAAVSTQVVSPFIISGAANSGVYLTTVKISFLGPGADTRFERSEQISLQVVAAPRLQMNFYRPLGAVFAGQPFALPIEIFNVGRGRVNSTTAGVASAQAQILSEPLYIGPLDAGISATLDAQALAPEPGQVQIDVRIQYIDDFNRPQTFEAPLMVTVEPAFVPGPGVDPAGPGGEPPDGPGTDPPRPARPLWLRVVRGLFGLGSAP